MPLIRTTISLPLLVYIDFIAVVGLLGAAVGHGFAHDRGARLGPRRLTLLAGPAEPRSRSASCSVSSAGSASVTTGRGTS
jgi:hypothetical protein